MKTINLFNDDTKKKQFDLADISNRKYIVITDQEMPRIINYNDVDYIKWLNLKYLEDYDEFIPYHYFISSNLETYSVKMDFLESDVSIFQGFKDDLIIYVEWKLKNATTDQITSLATLCTILCQKYSLSVDNFILFPYESVNDSSVAFTKEQLLKNISDNLEQINKVFILKHSFDKEDKIINKENKKVGFASFNKKVNSEELSNMFGIPPNILEEYNYYMKKLNDDKPQLNRFALQGYPTLPPYSGVIAAPYSLKFFGYQDAQRNQKEANFILNYIKDTNNLFANNNKNDNAKNNQIPNIPTTSFEDEFNELYDLGIKPFPASSLSTFELPGYQNAYFEFVNILTQETKSIGFMVSPNGVNHSMSTNQQVNKTMGGWFLMRMGKNLQNISLTGYLVDSKDCQERHNFIENYYKNYIEDKRGANNEYLNEWSVNLIIEGKKYIGFIQGMNIQKSSVQPFLYQYNINYISVHDTLLYRTEDSSNTRNNKTDKKNTDNNQLESSTNTNLDNIVASLFGLA